MKHEGTRLDMHIADERAVTQPVRIGNRLVGPGQPCFVVAEARVNHNGSLETAMQLIDVAVEAGADAVKFKGRCK